MNKITITTIEGPSVTVSAGYNPKELSFDKDAGWSEEAGGSGADMGVMQFTSGKGIKLSIDLLFDLYEESGDVRPIIANLMKTTLVDSSLNRPPRVQLLWSEKDVLFSGDFKGVVQSVKTKYTMFTSDGVPCRATATVSLVQAEAVAYVTEDSEGNSTSHVTVGSAQGVTSLPTKQRSSLRGTGFNEVDGPYPHTFDYTEDSGDSDN